MREREREREREGTKTRVLTGLRIKLQRFHKSGLAACHYKSNK
jgi:hypothetical protein